MTPLWLLVALAVTASCSFASAVLIPLVIAMFLAVLLEPVVAWVAVRGPRRGRAAVLVVLGFVAAVGASVWACSQPFSKIAADMPRYSAKIRTAASALDRRTREYTNRVPSPQAAAADGINSWRDFFWRGLGSFFEAAGFAAFVPFLMIMMLSEKDLLADAFARLAGGSCDVGLIERETAQMVRAYFYGNLMAGIGMAFFHWLVFAGLGLKNAVGLGLITGLLTLIPLIGLPAALLLPTAQGLLQFDRILPFIILAASMTALHMSTANYVIPRVIGGRVKINATAATAGLLFWGWLWGITGLLLAVPLTALLKVLLESSKDTAAYAGLLAAKPREPRPGLVRKWFAEARSHSRHLAPR